MMDSAAARGGGDVRGVALSSRRSPPMAPSATTTTTTPNLSPGGVVERETRRAMAEEGYDLDLFVPPADEKYICPICMMVLREPIQTQCGHRFCEVCFQKWVRESHKSLRCPVCSDHFPSNQVFKDKSAGREIMSLRVKCNNFKEGCSVQVELRHLEAHMKDCPYELLPCPNGCKAYMFRKRLNHHATSECTRRPVTCPRCGKLDVLYSEVKDHDSLCPERDVQCKKCGMEFIRKSELDHRAVCAKEQVPCFFRPFGCMQEFNRENEPRHMDNTQVYHLRCVGEYIKMWHTRAASISQSAPIGPARLTPHMLSSLWQDHGFVSGGTDQSEVSPSSLHQRAPILHSIRMEDSDVHLASDQPLDRQFLNKLLNESPGSSLEQEQRGSKDGKPTKSQTYPIEGSAKTSKKHESEQRLISSLKTIVQDHEMLIVEQQRRIDRHENTIRNLESHIRDSEGRQCNGMYIWKIKDFQRRKQEAKTGKSIVHHSPGFYTSFYGYKMCIRVNLNGVDAGYGNHLSVFIHLMQGEFDDLLKWPFQGKITLSVLDQSENMNQRRHITEMLVAKPDLAAFLRPTSRRNHKGFGYIEFAPIEYIESGTFIKNDMMIVKAIVEPSKELM